MKLLQRLFRFRGKSTRRAQSLVGQRIRPLLEGLETRLMPASVFVVPLSQVSDATHIYRLADAITAAGNGGVVTIVEAAEQITTIKVELAIGAHAEGGGNRVVTQVDAVHTCNAEA